MKSLFRTHKGEKGFTLVELLVVFTLLALLAAIIIPSVSRFIGYGVEKASDTELSIVQTAMDAMMARDKLGEGDITPTVNTNDMSSFPTGAALYPDYLRFATSTNNYTCDADGLVTIAADGFASID